MAKNGRQIWQERLARADWQARESEWAEREKERERVGLPAEGGEAGLWSPIRDLLHKRILMSHSLFPQSLCSWNMPALTCIFHYLSWCVCVCTCIKCECVHEWRGEIHCGCHGYLHPAWWQWKKTDSLLNLFTRQLCKWNIPLNLSMKTFYR